MMALVVFWISGPVQAGPIDDVVEIVDELREDATCDQDRGSRACIHLANPSCDDFQYFFDFVFDNYQPTNPNGGQFFATWDAPEGSGSAARSEMAEQVGGFEQIPSFGLQYFFTTGVFDSEPIAEGQRVTLTSTASSVYAGIVPLGSHARMEQTFECTSGSMVLIPAKTLDRLTYALIATIDLGVPGGWRKWPRTRNKHRNRQVRRRLGPSVVELIRPGLPGRTIRILLAAAVFFLGSGLVRNAASFWDGIAWSLHTLPLAAPIVLTSSWVVNELWQKQWGWWPLLALLGGAALAAGISLAMGDGPWGPLFGVYFWTWMAAWVLLLGPALLLAAVLATPGCEMRSYAQLWARLRGRDAAAVACPGWIDRFDTVRILGK